MSLTFSDGAYLAASGTRSAFGAASDRLVSEGHPAIRVVSADREPETQIAIFLDRYSPQASGGGRFGDVKWWQGVRYVRHSSEGPVAVPGTSNHESRRAADLAYPYNNRGTASHLRLRQIAAEYELDWTGRHFGEDWHWEHTGPLGVIGGTTPQPVFGQSEEDDSMNFLYTMDQGGTQPLWTMINSATGEIFQTRVQSEANSWSASHGASARTVSVQDLLNWLALIKGTTESVRADSVKLDKAIALLEAEADAQQAAAR